MIPFKEYVFDISFSPFSLQQLKTSWWLDLVKFSFTNTLVFGIEFLPILQDLLTIFSIHQSHDGLFWTIFGLSYGSFLYRYVGSLKYFNNGILKIFIPDIVRNSSYFNIISSIVLLHRIGCCFKNYDFKFKLCFFIYLFSKDAVSTTVCTCGLFWRFTTSWISTKLSHIK